MRGDCVIRLIAQMMAVKQEADRQIIQMLQAMSPEARAEEIEWIKNKVKEDGGEWIE